MKVIYLIPNMGHGGAEELVCNLTREMSQMHDVTLYLTYKHSGSKARIDSLGDKVNVKYLINHEMNKLSKTYSLVGIMIYLLAPIMSLYIFLRVKL